MAGIQEYLDKIKTAVYGRDVRQAIHDAIKTCYDDGSAGATDLTARENAATALETANQAMDSVNTTINQKFNSVFKLVSATTAVNFPSGTTNRDNLSWRFNLPEGYRIVALAGWNFTNFGAYWARINIGETYINGAIHGPSGTTLNVQVIALAAKKDFF